MRLSSSLSSSSSSSSPSSSHATPRRAAVLAALAFAALPLAAPSLAHADRVIDSFADPLPLTTLPGTSTPAPLLWAGVTGSVSQIEQSATQSNLPGVLGGQRFTRIREASLTTLVTVSSTTSASLPALSYASGNGKTGALTLEYGALTPLNANLTADGSLGFELDIVGDMDSTPNRPIQLSIAVRSGSGGVVTRSYALVRDGVYHVPFSAFSGVNFADVDFLRFTFDGSLVTSVDYTLRGGLRTTGCLQSGTPIGDVFLDTFRAALPPRTLPGSGTFPILWAGTINGVVKPIDAGAQTGLSGTLGGQRTTTIQASAISNFLTGVMTTQGPDAVFGYATGTGTSGSVTLEYGDAADLNANLSAMRAFELELSGDLTSGPRPVPLTITVASSTGSASTTVTLLDNRSYYIPFTYFPGVNFANVDYVQFHFDATAVSSVDFDLIGGLRASACIR